jgi:hypothetical protein
MGKDGAFGKADAKSAMVAYLHEDVALTRNCQAQWSSFLLLFGIYLHADAGR